MSYGTIKAGGRRMSKAIIRGPLTFPDLYMCKLCYSTQITQTGSTISTNTFRVGSIFDPDFTGTGGQPTGHDQLALLYERYQVNGLRYDITVVNVSDTVQARCMLWAGDDDTAWGNLETASTNANASEILMLQTADGGHNIVRFKGFLHPRKLLGVNKTQYRYEPQYSSGFGNNPAVPCFIQILSEELVAGASIDITMQVRLTYYVTCYRRVELSSS